MFLKQTQPNPRLAHRAGLLDGSLHRLNEACRGPNILRGHEPDQRAPIRCAQCAVFDDLPNGLICRRFELMFKPILDLVPLRALNHTGVEMGVVANGTDAAQFPKRKYGNGTLRDDKSESCRAQLQNASGTAAEHSDSLDAWPDAIQCERSFLSF